MNLNEYEIQTGPEEGGNSCAYRFLLLVICCRKSNHLSDDKSLGRNKTLWEFLQCDLFLFCEQNERQISFWTYPGRKDE